MYGIQLVIDFNFVKISILMFEEAPLPIWAEQSFLESSTYLGFVFGINGLWLFDELLITMSELTFVSVSTDTNFYPVLAHLSLKFSLISLHRALAYCLVTLFSYLARLLLRILLLSLLYLKSRRGTILYVYIILRGNLRILQWHIMITLTIIHGV